MSRVEREGVGDHRSVTQSKESHETFSPESYLVFFACGASTELHPMLLIQILTIVLMFGMTFVIYKALGPAQRGLLYTREYKAKWDAFIKTHALGGVLTTFNVVGTLTSLAGAYVFFMGSSKLFGFFILLCSFTFVFPGAFITIRFSKRIMASPRLKALLHSPNQTGGVIAALFWAEDAPSQHTARLVKWFSVFNLVAVLWIEFTVFAAIGEHLLRLESPLVAPILLCVSCYTIALFTLIYGVRGFVFADLFHVPLVILASLAILGGCIWLTYQGWGSQVPSSIRTIIWPDLPILACILFSAHILCLNGIQLLTTEHHWLRLWIFREKETDGLKSATAFTAMVWAVLSAIGLLAFYLSGKTLGVPAVVALLSRLNELSIIFIAVFWIGGIAALFSTTDAGLYALLVVSGFRPKEGKLHDRDMAKLRPFRTSAWIAVGTTGAYIVLVQFMQLPIEKLLFLVFPLSLNLFPAFVRAFRGLPQSPWYIIVALVLYVGCAVAGLRQPLKSFEWTLAAGLMPIIVGIFAGVSKWFAVAFALSAILTGMGTLWAIPWLTLGGLIAAGSAFIVGAVIVFRTPPPVTAPVPDGALE